MKLLDILKKLANPIELVKSLLVSKYLGGFIRHLLTGLGGFLVLTSVLSIEEAKVLEELIAKILVSPEFWQGILAYLVGYVGSIVQKKSK